MKIGILTYHCVTNFGAQLQTLSSIGYFKSKGYEPIVLDWFPEDLENFYKSEVPMCQYLEQMKFAETMMPLSNLCRSVEDVAKEIERLGIEAIFIGSDALFDYTPMKNRSHFSLKKLRFEPIRKVGATHDLPNAFWGGFNDFLSNPIKCAGFSISSQNAAYFRYNRNELKELKRLLSYFRFLSLRDEWTCKMVKYIGYNGDAHITPDPVFAFNHNNDFGVTKKEILEKYNLPEDYVLISFCQDKLDDNFINGIIKEIEKKSHYRCVSFPMPRKQKEYNTRYKIDLPLDTLDWYYLIKYSRGYIGELMHPIIVCLHNAVPFYCFDQYGTYKTIIPMIWHKRLPTSSKIYDILNRADFLSNVVSYHNSELPTVDMVVEKFLSFNIDKCKLFADKMLKNYLHEMHLVEQSLT